MPQQLISIREASEFASKLLDKEISALNISYLVQYGKVQKFNNNGSTLVDIDDLKKYYISINRTREMNWKKKLGNDLNWTLSFDHLREKDTTKHVHRLHPYKGKFIPQLVEYFIDNHVDNFKKSAYFKPGDIILDPFSGSGTTLVQANEMGMHSIGVDISSFNCMIAQVKLLNYDFLSLEKEIQEINRKINSFETNNKVNSFEQELLRQLAEFNDTHFPSPEFKYRIQRVGIEDSYIVDKENKFLKIYDELVRKYNIKLNQSKNKAFLDKWFVKNVREEIDFAFSLVKKIKDIKNKKMVALILSRTIRSCRATMHSDLATLKEPQLTTYYCFKHKKICRPLLSIKSWFDRYASDSINRLKIFSRLKKNVYFSVIPTDSRVVDIFKEVERRNSKFYQVLQKQKIKGIFTSPPYVGQIDYHEQHAYAYDLFGFKRRDELEIGSLYKGQGVEAQKSYIEGVSKVLMNSKKYLAQNYDIFIVANDKYNLYPEIANKSGMKIINMYKRPVLNRTERDKSPYSESIFHLKGIK